MKRTYLLAVGIACLLMLVGCYNVGHQDAVEYRNDEIGTRTPYRNPFKFKNAGQLIRADFAIAGQGLTHITKDENGDLVYHFNVQEILPHFHTKEWVGVCLIYKVVDPETYIIKDWGFDAGGNPLSCRTWP